METLTWTIRCQETLCELQKKLFQLTSDNLLFCIIDYRCFYFLFQLCVLHDLVLLWIQVLLILGCDKDRVSLRRARIYQRMSWDPLTVFRCCLIGAFDNVISEVIIAAAERSLCLCVCTNTRCS